MIAGIEFASCYVYSPTGAGVLCERSRLLCRLLKDGDARFLEHYARQVREQMSESMPMAAFLSPRDVLVPVPGCAPRSSQRRCVAELLADALLQQGLGGESWRGLKRVRRVPKSATAPQCARPSVALHYESFSIAAMPCAARSLVLVDDVVTKGRTLLAAAALLHKAFPGANIRAFAMLRTLGHVPELQQLLQPCKGRISWRRGDACREP